MPATPPAPTSSSSWPPRDDGTPYTRLRVRLAGEEYVLRGDMSPQRLEELVAELDRRLQELARRYPRLSFHQTAVLCALQLLEELQRLRDENRELRELLGLGP